jgi:hypothetical protein
MDSTGRQVYIKWLIAGFLGLLMAQGAVSAESKFLSS